MSGNSSSLTIPTASAMFSHPCIIIYICFFITTALVLLLFAPVLYMGHHRWRKKSSVGRATISHSDVLTYNIIPLELFGVLSTGCVLYLMLTNVTPFLQLSQILASVSMNGQNAIHLLTCVEHYVAVLHPVQYLKSKKPRSIRMRNISIVCFWLFLIVGSSVAVPFVKVGIHEIYISAICILGLQFVFVVYCHVSILCSLTRPVPGVARRNTVSVDLKKRRAFYTVTVIMGVLLIRFLGSLFQLICLLWMGGNCLAVIFLLWFSLPSSLVQPLLFLHRAGKLPFCRTQRSRCST